MNKALVPTLATSAIILGVLLMGAALFVPKVHAQSVEVSLPIVQSDAGETISIPVTIDDVTGLGLISYTIRVIYDADVLHIRTATISGTLSDIEGSSRTQNVKPDEYTLVYAAPSTRPLEGGGTLVNLTADVIGEGTTDLSFGFLRLENVSGEIASTGTGGMLTTENVETADLGVSLSIDPHPVQVGGDISVILAISNAGPDDASEVNAEVSLPSEVAFNAADGCSFDAETHRVGCAADVLAAGDTETFEINLKAPELAQVLELAATVSAVTFDSDHSNNSASVSFAAETDSDGVDDETEANVPNRDGQGTGDGNGDGIPDNEQSNVASLPNATTGEYVTIESVAGTELRGVTVAENPPAEILESISLPDGVLAFRVASLEAGGSTTVTIYTNQEVNSYYKFGPTPDDPTDHWYEFLYDGTTGAEILDDRIVLHLVDGMRGDSDLTANGEIDDPGAPALDTNEAPTAMDDEYETNEDETLTVSLSASVLLNDSDPNGDDLQVFLVDSTEFGALTLERDGTFTYEPNPDFFGTDGFRYRATDGLKSDTASVAIIVHPVNDAPSASRLVSPSEGAEFTVGGSSVPEEGESLLFRLTVDAADDPEDDELTYQVVVSSDEASSSVIETMDLESETEIDVTMARAAEWFDAAHGEPELGVAATVYLRALVSDGEATTSGEATSIVLVRGTIVSTADESLPGDFALEGNYPNPFNPSTTVTFALPTPALVSLEVVDMLGRRVMNVPGKAFEAGHARRMEVDASQLPSGSYVYRVTAETTQETHVSSGVMTVLK